MDALKKAEQEKKEAAKRLEQASELARIERTGEHPADVTSEHDVAGSGSVAEPAPPPESRDTAPAPLLSLTPMDAQAATAPAAPAKSMAQPREAVTKEAGLDPGRSALHVETSAPKIAQDEKTQEVKMPTSSAQDLNQTFHGVALPEGMMPGMYEETVQGEQFETVEPAKSYEETLPGVPAVQFARDIGGKDQPTPVAAQTVFSAGETGRQSTSSGLRWAYSVLPLFLIAALVWYYYTVTPMNLQVRSPFVARGIETVAPGPPTPPEASVTSPIAAGSMPGIVTGQPGAGAVSGPSATAPEAGLKAPAQGTKGPARVAPAEIAQEIARAEGTSAPAPAPESSPKPAEAVVPASMGQAPPARFAAPPSLIKITHGKKPSDEGRLILQAFADYNAGNLEAAKAAYMEALSRLPDNLDALLGLGAIAQKEGDSDRALEIYTRILRLDPRDETAVAALISMQKDNDLLASESSLKSLLQEDPDNPYLYFTLGTVYAGQQRWAEAQQAFFDAYRNDSSNPDYALNLAISLDRLGQRETALDYYNVALKLADERRAGFDSGAILARIQDLSAAQTSP